MVVPSHGAARVLPGLLDALERQTLAPDRFEILVADPGTDGAARVLDERLARWRGAPLRILRAPLDGGPAAKRNLAVDEAAGELLAFTDADCRPEPGWLEAGLAASNEADLVQGRTLPPVGAQWHPLSHAIRIEAESGLFETCNLFARTALVRSLGGFTTRYFTRYGVPFGEDAELGWRARRSGARFAFASAAVVRHPVGEPSLRAHVRERWTTRGFPALVADVPELRDRLWSGLFLSRRSAETWLAAAGALLALSAGRRRAVLGAALALPYAARLGGELRRWPPGPRGRAGYAAAKATGDLVRAAALAQGSVRARTLVL